ncbi:MAG: hypothetical protein R3279_11830, partial [Putridiphycobacter sp.]|nr:hypothetical protein [Putridiphycobacter sp.]
YEVDGDLSETEHQALTQVLSGVGEMADEFFKADLLMYTGLSDIEVNEKLDALEIEPRFHFGGYGKWTNELVDFMNSFYSETAIPLDQIYTGKMMFSFFQMLKEGRFLRGSKIVLLHTGGLQGTASIQNKLQFS